MLTQRGNHAVVADNHVENIGMKDNDKLANPNAPEILLAESYRLNYEGVWHASQRRGGSCRFR